MRLLEFLANTFEVMKVLPWLSLVACFLPLIILAWWKRIYPTPRFLAAMAVPCALTLSLLGWSDLFLVVAIADVAVVLVGLADVSSLPGRRMFKAERNVARIASLQVPQRVTLVVSNLSRRPYLVSIRDEVPGDFTANPQEFTLRFAPNSRATMH